MEQIYLMPGQERCEQVQDASGVPKVSYSYRSLKGALPQLRRERKKASAGKRQTPLRFTGGINSRKRYPARNTFHSAR